MLDTVLYTFHMNYAHSHRAYCLVGEKYINKYSYT